MIKIIPYNETYIRVHCTDFGIEQELSEFFTFYAQNYKFQPKFKSGQWDGKIRLLNSRNKCLYKGLLDVVVKFAKDRDYQYEVHEDLITSSKVTLEDVTKFMELLKIPERIVKRDYQFEAVHHAVTNRRCILESATSSGKSLMIYSTIRYHLMKKRRVLLIVPNINLVKQMYSDFVEYSVDNKWDVENNVHLLFDGQSRVFQTPVVISTWQTILSMTKTDQKSLKELMDNTDVIIGDEAHQFKSTEVSKIMDSFTEVAWRTGTTGTLDGIKLNILTLTGIFGPALGVISARELIDQGYATPVEVRIIVLKHPEEIRKAFKGMKYIEEVKHIISNQARNQFIANLAKACSGNTLILYNFVQKHGNLIHEKLLKTIPPNRKVYYIHGGVEADEREAIRKIVETEEDAVILATSSLMSTGTNMPSIENLILTMPGKSNTRIRQSAGRTLRLKKGKVVSKVFDIADDFRWKSWTNTAMKHLDERIRIYSQEQFPMKVIDADLKY